MRSAAVLPDSPDPFDSPAPSESAPSFLVAFSSRLETTDFAPPAQSPLRHLSYTPEPSRAFLSSATE